MGVVILLERRDWGWEICFAAKWYHLGQLRLYGSEERARDGMNATTVSGSTKKTTLRKVDISFVLGAFDGQWNDHRMRVKI